MHNLVRITLKRATTVNRIFHSIRYDGSFYHTRTYIYSIFQRFLVFTYQSVNTQGNGYSHTYVRSGFRECLTISPNKASIQPINFLQDIYVTILSREINGQTQQQTARKYSFHSFFK